MVGEERKEKGKVVGEDGVFIGNGEGTHKSARTSHRTQPVGKSLIVRAAKRGNWRGAWLSSPLFAVAMRLEYKSTKPHDGCQDLQVRGFVVSNPVPYYLEKSGSVILLLDTAYHQTESPLDRRTTPSEPALHTTVTCDLRNQKTAPCSV